MHAIDGPLQMHWFRYVLRLQLAGSLLAPTAAAYCRTTTCDPQLSCDTDPERCCDWNEDGCDINGLEVAWPSSCVSYNVHEDGSDETGISADELSDILHTSFSRWLTVECNEELVPLTVDFRGSATCGHPEYNTEKGAQNANIWTLRDDRDLIETTEFRDGEIDSRALAITTLSFDELSAQLLDADVEIHSGAFDFTLGDSDIKFDLESVVMHEAGHFLGIAHSEEATSTMSSGALYGDTEKRSLEIDDLLAICDAYPGNKEFPAGDTCEPQGGYSPHCYEPGCGCAQAGLRHRPVGLSILSLLIFSLGVRRWRGGRNRRAASLAELRSKLPAIL